MQSFFRFDVRVDHDVRKTAVVQVTGHRLRRAVEEEPPPTQDSAHQLRQRAVTHQSAQDVRMAVLGFELYALQDARRERIEIGVSGVTSRPMSSLGR